jgi:hypothetical protein
MAALADFAEPSAHYPSRNWGHRTVCQASSPTGGSPVRVRHSEPPGSECCRRRGNAGSEAYTVIVWGVGLSHEMTTSRRPRPSCAPKAICVVPPSRGAIAPPGSKATSRTNRSRRNLGGPAASADRSFGGAINEGRLKLVAPRLEVGPPHSVRLTADASGGLKSHSARGSGLISEGGGNSSPAKEDGKVWRGY